MIIVHILLLGLFLYLLFCVLYGFIYSLAGRIGRLKKVEEVPGYKKFAVFIPSYKEDGVIIQSAEEALKQDYPKDFFEVIVIADSLKEATLNKLADLPIRIINVSFEVSTKAKSLNQAMKVLPEQYDYALILDADNIMEPAFLSKMNKVILATHCKALQGHRVAKNINTKFAILDAISEEVNNHIYRKGHRVLGFSSGLIGSGMAFEYSYFKKVMSTVHAVGGFDKELEVKLNRDKVTIEYVEDAMVYDEKVENAEVFEKQRRRWISAQLVYLRRYFFASFKHLFLYGNIDMFNKVLQFTLVPRVMLMAVVLVTCILAVLFNIITGISAYPSTALWVSLLLIHTVTFLLAIPSRFYTKETLSAIIEVPRAMLIMFLNFFKLKGANAKYIHTPHSGSFNAGSQKIRKL
ncbi:MAG TPA: glycosyltransferase family 2 protein [Cytophagaceae bacterium]